MSLKSYRSFRFLRLTILVLCLTVGVASYAKADQDRIDGFVFDIFGKPIAGARASVDNTRFSATTSGNGQFFLDYAPGAFSITITKRGYTAAKSSLNIAQKSKYPLQDTVLFPIPDKVGFFFVDKKRKQLVNLVEHNAIGYLVERREQGRSGMATSYIRADNRGSRPFKVEAGTQIFINTFPEFPGSSTRVGFFGKPAGTLYSRGTIFGTAPVSEFHADELPSRRIIGRMGYSVYELNVPRNRPVIAVDVFQRGQAVRARAGGQQTGFIQFVGK